MRQPLLGVAIGRKASGKTYATIQIINRYLRGNPQTGAQARRVLIMDTNNEFANVPSIRVSDVGRFSVHKIIEARRIPMFKEGGGKMSLDEYADVLLHVLRNFYNGMILIEDITKYVSDSLPNDLIGSICTQRHMDCDIIIHFQNVGKLAHPKIWANCNWIRMHKCGDTVERHKNKFTGNLEHLYIMEALVNYKYSQGDQYFHAYMNTDQNTIRGNFTQDEFVEAIRVYLSENYNKVLKPILNKRDLDTGRLIHDDHGTMVKQEIDKMVSRYYGN